MRTLKYFLVLSLLDFYLAASCQTATSLPDVHFRQGLSGPIKAFSYVDGAEPFVITLSSYFYLNYFSYPSLKEFRHEITKDTHLFESHQFSFTDTNLVAFDSKDGVLEWYDLQSTKKIDSAKVGSIPFLVDTKNSNFVLMMSDSAVDSYDRLTKTWRRGLIRNTDSICDRGKIIGINYDRTYHLIALLVSGSVLNQIAVYRQDGSFLGSVRIIGGRAMTITPTHELIVVTGHGVWGIDLRTIPLSKHHLASIDYHMAVEKISNDGAYIFYRRYGHGPQTSKEQTNRLFIFDVANERTTDSLEVEGRDYYYEPKLKTVFFSEGRADLHSQQEQRSLFFQMGMYNLGTRQFTYSNTGTFSGITAFDYSKDCQKLALLNRNLELRVFDIRNRQFFNAVYIKDSADLRQFWYDIRSGIFFSTHGKYLIAYSRNRIIAWKTNDFSRWRQIAVTDLKGICPTSVDSIIYVENAAGLSRLNIDTFTYRLIATPVADPGGVHSWHVLKDDLAILLKSTFIDKSGNLITSTLDYFDKADRSKDSVLWYDLKSGKIIKSTSLGMSSDVRGGYTIDRNIVTNSFELYYKRGVLEIDEKRLKIKPLTAVPDKANGLLTLFNGNIVTNAGFIDKQNDRTVPFKGRLWFSEALSTRMDAPNRVMQDSAHFFLLKLDGSFQILNSKTGAEDLSVVSYANNPGFANNWLCVTPQGYFDGNSGVLDLFYWQYPNSANRLTYEKYYTTFSTPNLIFHILNQDFMPHLDIGYYTRIPGLEEMLTEGTARPVKRNGINYLCLRDLTIFNELNTLAGDSDIIVSPVDTECKALIRLPSGSDALAIQSNVPSAPRPDSDYYLNKGPRGNLYIVTIGCSHYSAASKMSTLPYSILSAENIRSLFDSSGALFHPCFDTVYMVNKLFDSQATYSNIIAQLNYTFKSLKSEDCLIAYFIGHGIIPENSQMFYYLPFDADTKDEDHLKGTAISAAQFADIPVFLKAKRTFIIVDACQSGGSLRSLRKASEARGESPDDHSSTNVLAASSSLEAAQQGSKGSALEIAIVNAFENSIRNNKNLTVHQLIDAIITNSKKTGDVLPTFYGFSNGPDFQLLKFDSK